MSDTHIQFQQALHELRSFTAAEKIKFLEVLLFSFTISGRGIWSDEQATDTEKANAFKWQNELFHRIWNIRRELERNEDNEFVERLYGNMKFYGEQSALLRIHLVPTTLMAFKNFKQNNNLDL